MVIGLSDEYLRFVFQRCHFDHRVTFTFLDRSFLAVTPQIWNSSLHVYRYDPAPEAEPVSSRARRHVLELGLPAKDARIQESSIPLPPPCTAIFWPDPKQRIYVISLGEHSSLLIPYSTFRCLLETLQVTPTPSSEPTRLAWESWGPDSTLRLDLERRHHWKTNCCYSYGSRVAVFSFDKDSRSPDCTVVIFDLNPWAVRHAQHCPPKTPTNPKVAFGIDRATLPHLALHGPVVSVGLPGQAPPMLTMDIRGFTAVVSILANPLRPDYSRKAPAVHAVSRLANIFGLSILLHLKIVTRQTLFAIVQQPLK